MAFLPGYIHPSGTTSKASILYEDWGGRWEGRHEPFQRTSSLTASSRDPVMGLLAELRVEQQVRPLGRTLLRGMSTH